MQMIEFELKLIYNKKYFIIEGLSLNINHLQILGPVALNTTTTIYFINFAVQTLGVTFYFNMAP